MIISIFLIIVGVLWLLSNTGVIATSVADFLWPAVLIAVGLQLLWDYFKRDRNCCKPK
ncbi:MAG: DUF5668 domain-containing protein [Candidatus Berkelbacteria bacterium]|nr:DUF5668 domain-containing protein [Candidatus Berkelbacteria bacterium]